MKNKLNKIKQNLKDRAESLAFGALMNGVRAVELGILALIKAKGLDPKSNPQANLRRDLNFIFDDKNIKSFNYSEYVNKRKASYPDGLGNKAYTLTYNRKCFNRSGNDEYCTKDDSVDKDCGFVNDGYSEDIFKKMLDEVKNDKDYKMFINEVENKFINVDLLNEDKIISELLNRTVYVNDSFELTTGEDSLKEIPIEAESEEYPSYDVSIEEPVPEMQVLSFDEYDVYKKIIDKIDLSEESKKLLLDKLLKMTEGTTKEEGKL